MLVYTVMTRSLFCTHIYQFDSWFSLRYHRSRRMISCRFSGNIYMSSFGVAKFDTVWGGTTQRHRFGTGRSYIYIYIYIYILVFLDQVRPQPTQEHFCRVAISVPISNSFAVVLSLLLLILTHLFPFIDLHVLLNCSSYTCRSFYVKMFSDRQCVEFFSMPVPWVLLISAGLPWASYQIRKIAVCACAGNVRNVFPATDFKGNR